MCPGNTSSCFSRLGHKSHNPENTGLKTDHNPENKELKTDHNPENKGLKTDHNPENTELKTDHNPGLHVISFIYSGAALDTETLNTFIFLMFPTF